jgi:hypothetical protein
MSARAPSISPRFSDPVTEDLKVYERTKNPEALRALVMSLARDRKPALCINNRHARLTSVHFKTSA